MSKNIVFEGWLTKSPPSKRIWRTKWRRRWFALRQSGELPGQYFLDYYADRNCRRPKGTINLDLCEQVDAGLHMERTGTGSLDPKLRGSVFTIQTQSRTYHLEADCEAEMAKWVDAICRVCGLRSTDDEDNTSDKAIQTEDDKGHSHACYMYQNSLSARSAGNEQNERAENTDSNTGSYIPISECITGVRAQDRQRAFTFETKSNLKPCQRVSEDRGRHVYTTQPQIRLNNTELSENESKSSDDECKSLNASQSNIPDWAVKKTFTKLTISPNRNGCFEEGPPVPPRPPKTFARPKGFIGPREIFQGPKFQEPTESQDNIRIQGQRVTWLRVPQANQPRTSHGPPSSPGRSQLSPVFDEEEAESQGQLSMQYCNLSSMPPAVDRTLKPRYSSHIAQLHHPTGQTGMQIFHHDEIKSKVLQYLDLDLPMSTPEPSKVTPLNKIIHGKSLSSIEADSAYKTVDFLKTEAFNITRQDAEASRSNLP